MRPDVQHGGIHNGSTSDPQPAWLGVGQPEGFDRRRKPLDSWWWCGRGTRADKAAANGDASHHTSLIARLASGLMDAVSGAVYPKVLRRRGNRSLPFGCRGAGRRWCEPTCPPFCVPGHPPRQ